MIFRSDDISAQPEQQTSRWHDWRRKGIGASDVPIILGLSPWKTPLELYEEKISTSPKKESGNFATQRGQWLEQEARTQYELLVGQDAPPILVVHPEYEFMRASLDGYVESEKIVLEIKCPGREDHKTALNGKVPEKYYPQVQYQLLITGADKAHYFSFDGEAGCIVEVKPDADYQAMLVERVKNFWEENVLKRVPPEPSKQDKVHVTDDSGKSLFRRFKAIKQEIDRLTEELNIVREDILSRFKGQERTVECEGVQLLFTIRKGAVDYDSIPQLEKVDLDQYRKPSAVVPMIKLI
jgi:putative phage-type endonuclease